MQPQIVCIIPTDTMYNMYEAKTIIINTII